LAATINTKTSLQLPRASPGGYVVAVRKRKYLPLRELEEAEFQQSMFGRDEAREQAPDAALLLQRKLNPQE